MKNQNETKKWNSGWILQGVYRQWLVDNHPEMLELKAIDIISRHTFGYLKRYGFIKQEVFGMTQSKTHRQVKKAKNSGLLKATRTRHLTRYELVLPTDIENDTSWAKSRTTTEKETEPIKILADTGSVL